jgi:hypothetical protein
MLAWYIRNFRRPTTTSEFSITLRHRLNAPYDRRVEFQGGARMLRIVSIFPESTMNAVGVGLRIRAVGFRSTSFDLAMSSG